MKQGVILCDPECCKVRFDLEEFSDELRCGTCLDVMVGNRWKPSRLEMDWLEDRWYLVDIHTNDINGLRVRTYDE